MKFAPRDTNKKVKLRNGQSARIISVIKEYGHVCLIVGRVDDETIAMWSDDGKSELPFLDIVEIINE